MKNAYKVKIQKRKIGFTVENIPPDLKGTIIVSVQEMASNGDCRVFVVDCSRNQHKANLELEGVSELSKK